MGQTRLVLATRVSGLLPQACLKTIRVLEREWQRSSPEGVSSSVASTPGHLLPRTERHCGWLVHLIPADTFTSRSDWKGTASTAARGRICLPVSCNCTKHPPIFQTKGRRNVSTDAFRCTLESLLGGESCVSTGSNIRV